MFVLIITNILKHNLKQGFLNFFFLMLPLNKLKKLRPPQNSVLDTLKTFFLLFIINSRISSEGLPPDPFTAQPFPIGPLPLMAS